MSVVAIIFGVIFLIGVLITIICVIFNIIGDVEPITTVKCFICFFIPTLIVYLLNFFVFPQHDARYRPITSIAASLNQIDDADKNNLYIDQPFYLQIRVKVESNSFARRILNDKEIPFRVEISNPKAASFEIQRSEGFEEYMEPEIHGDKTVYFLKVLAAHPRDAEFATINFRGLAKEAGTQQVRLIFDGKASGAYSRIETLEYKPYMPIINRLTN